MISGGLLQPNILIQLDVLGIGEVHEIKKMLARFERIELVYLALEIIYDKELSKGYRKLCSRLFPEDNGEKIIFLLDQKLKKTDNKIAEYHLVCMQTGLELLKVLLSDSESYTPWNFEKIPNGSEIKGVNLLTILLLVNERITKNLSVPDNYKNTDIDTAKYIIANGIAATLVGNSDYSNFDITTSPFVYTINRLYSWNFVLHIKNWRHV